MRFSLAHMLFKYLVSRSKFIFIGNNSAKNWAGFRKLEVTLSDDRQLIFSFLHNRRRRSAWDIFITYMVHVEVNVETNDGLTELLENNMLTVDVPFGSWFSNDVVGDVLIENYLDNIINILKCVEDDS